MVSFRQFLRKYGMTLLPVSVSTIAPGHILYKKNRGYYPYAHLSEVLNISSSKFKTGWIDAHITEESISRSLSLKGKYSLRAMGVNISGGLAKAKKANFVITGIKARNLTNLSTMEMESYIELLKKNRKASWKKLKKKCLIELTFYASEFTLSFETEGSVDINLEIGNKLTHDPGSEVRWTSQNTLKISRNDKVPFGFKGVPLR